MKPGKERNTLSRDNVHRVTTCGRRPIDYSARGSKALAPNLVVTAWIGNSALIAAKHYLQVTDEHFERAIQDMRKPELTTPEAAQNPTHMMHATQIPTSPTAAARRHMPHGNRTGAPENDDRQLLAICGDTLRESPIAPRGSEPSALAMSKTPISQEQSAQNYTPRAPDSPSDHGLAQIVAAWPDLPEDVKRKILHLVRSQRPTPEAPA